MEEQNNKASLLQSIGEVKKAFDKSDKKLNPHVLVMLELDENGIPIGTLMSVSGGPLNTLGMTDLLIAKLEDIKMKIYDKIDEMEDSSRKLSNHLSEEIQDKLKDLEMRARRAMQEDNIEEAEKISMEVKEILKNFLGESIPGLNTDEDKDDTNPKSDFNLDDFKDM